MELDALMDALSIDRQEISSRFCNNFSLYERFLRKFSQDPTYESLRSAHEQGDANGYLTAVHTLKGVAGNLGLTQLFTCCTQLLTALRGGQTLAQTQSLGEQLDAEYQRIKKLIEQP